MFNQTLYKLSHTQTTAQHSKLMTLSYLCTLYSHIVHHSRHYLTTPVNCTRFNINYLKQCLTLITGIHYCYCSLTYGLIYNCYSLWTC